MPIYRPSSLRCLRPKRSLSQHFLIDQNIIHKTLRAAGVEPGDQILEIGPGPGAITEQLLRAGARVTAIEKDQELAQRLKGRENLTIICADALTYPLETTSSKTIANPPYSIITPLIKRLITETKTTTTLFVQEEVGRCICAKANTPEYSHLSLFIKCYSSPKYCFSVAASCFYPAPKVKSCVIQLNPHPFPFPIDQRGFFTMTKTAFGKRRKMLRNSLRDYGLPKTIEEILSSMDHDPQARPGELSSERFAALYEKLKEHPKTEDN